MTIDQKSLDLINKQRQYLKDNFSSIFDKMLEIESKYSMYNFMVFDLPKFELDDPELFHSIWNQYNIDCGRERTDIASPYHVDTTPRFRCLDIIETMPDRKRIWTTNYKDLSDKFPKFYQQLYDLLPFDKINYVRLWQSIGPIRMHRDDSWWYVDSPTEVRIMIYDENDTGTLKIEPECVPNDQKFINLPNDSNSFAWNNVRCLHGSTKENNKEKILACITGSFNLDKLSTLYESSIKKYDTISSKTIDDPYSKLLINT